MLFDEIEPEQPAAVFSRARATEDDVPAPAYQPVAPAAPPAAARATPAGTPSADTLARLQAAVAKVPQATSPAARPHAEAERPRFGINSLINRMTGHPGETPPERHQPSLRAQQLVEDDEVDAEKERIEIPAFLRRQAN